VPWESPATGLAATSKDSLFKGYSGHCQRDGKIKQGKGQGLPPSASSVAELIPNT